MLTGSGAGRVPMAGVTLAMTVVVSLELAPEVLTELSESSQKTKEITPSQKQLITPVWQYISTTPATELTKKGLQKVIDNHYKSK